MTTSSKVLPRCGGDWAQTFPEGQMCLEHEWDRIALSSNADEYKTKIKNDYVGDRFC